MTITFEPFTQKHLPLWSRWTQIPHVKDSWFVEGYESADKINEKIAGNGHTFPFVIMIDDTAIGYIQCCDLYAYRTIEPKAEGLFANENKGTFCVDIFIADSEYLNKGYGTQVIKQFCHRLFNEYNANKILIDPASSNQRAIRCYEKAGFQFVKNAHDGITDCTIMQLLPDNKLPFSPACERNKQPILEKLRQYLKSGDHVLEIGSGTGQHIDYFASHLPDIVWQPSDQGDYFQLLQQRMAVISTKNILPAKLLDVMSYHWGTDSYDVIFSANTLHIMNKTAGDTFLLNLNKALKPSGHLIIYGPFCYNGQFTSPNNQQFDHLLKSKSSEQGIREFNHISQLLAQQGFVLVEDHAMPANNQLLVWQYKTKSLI